MPAPTRPRATSTARRRAEQHGHDRHRRLDRHPHGLRPGSTRHGRLGGWAADPHAECGNKGICDRKSGECARAGYWRGLPGGRGDATCSATASAGARDLAAADHGVRNLWDSEVTMGCGESRLLARRAVHGKHGLIPTSTTIT